MRREGRKRGLDGVYFFFFGGGGAGGGGAEVERELEMVGWSRCHDNERVMSLSWGMVTLVLSQCAWDRIPVVLVCKVKTRWNRNMT